MTTETFVRIVFYAPERGEQVASVVDTDLGGLMAVERELRAHPNDPDARTARMRVQWPKGRGRAVVAASEVRSAVRVGGAAEKAGG